MLLCAIRGSTPASARACCRGTSPRSSARYGSSVACPVRTVISEATVQQRTALYADSAAAAHLHKAVCQALAAQTLAAPRKRRGQSSDRSHGSISARTACAERARAATDDARRARTNTTKLVRRRAARGGHARVAAAGPGRRPDHERSRPRRPSAWKSKFRRPTPSTRRCDETH